MPKRRANNEGTIYQRKDGRWVVEVRLTGKRISRYARSQADAVVKLNELRGQAYAGTLSVPTGVTLRQWIEQWLIIKEPSLRPSTIYTYRQSLACVFSLIGDHPLHKLTPMVLTLAFAQLQKRHNAQRRLNLAHGYLRQCLDYAVSMELLGTNPLSKVPKPKWTPKRKRYWSFEETNRFIQTALRDPSKYAPLFVLMVTTGMRLSEALALTWDDVDIDKRKVHVTRALVWVPKHGYIEVPPKTAAGSRAITLPETALAALALVSRRKGCLFSAGTGSLPQPSDLRVRLLSLSRSAEVPAINLHGLRHVHAMLALEVVKDPYLVQQRLGHASVAVTLTVYGYPTRDESQIADELDKRLGSG